MRPFQARLLAKQDKIKRKMFDNSIKWVGNTIDMVRIKTNLTHQGDIESREISKADTLEIIMPPLKDIPLRRVIKDGSGLIMDSISSLDEENKGVEVYAPMSSDVTRDDLLFWVLYDDNADLPIILCLQVKDILGTFGGHELLYQKYKTTYYNETLPSKLIQLVVKSTTRRNKLNF